MIMVTLRDFGARDGSERRQRLALGERERANLPALLQVRTLSFSATRPLAKQKTKKNNEARRHKRSRCIRGAPRRLGSWMQRSTVAARATPAATCCDTRRSGLLAAHLEVAPLRLVSAAAVA
jgi:hypothetical protein